MFSNAPKQGVKFSMYSGDDDSTTEAHIRQKVTYKVAKFSDIVHMKRSLTTRLYNLSQNGKISRLFHLVMKGNKLPGKMLFLRNCTKQRQSKRYTGNY